MSDGRATCNGTRASSRENLSAQRAGVVADPAFIDVFYAAPQRSFMAAYAQDLMAADAPVLTNRTSSAR